MPCQEMTAEFGMDVAPTRVEVLWLKAKRPVARGRPGPGPLHACPRCGLARRQVMTMVIDQ
ncbi:hypothetical protein GCM10010344_34830 [Streptomyces bluensis]|nr:hypothetical protein GCM10010344_34830 [Streptomyces bluensis]